jgi:hypothetical protein
MFSRRESNRLDEEVNQSNNRGLKRFEASRNFSKDLRDPATQPRYTMQATSQLRNSHMPDAIQTDCSGCCRG